MSDLQLDTLEAKGLIRLATLDPELEYLFRHALVQDTAYDSLLKQERRALHRLVGDALEELYPERRADLAAVLAMHFEQAGDTERAITYLMAAAQFAYERNAVVEAFDLYSRAAATLPEQADDENEATLRRRVEIGIGQARTGFSFLSRDSQVTLIEQTVANAERLGDLRLIGDAHLYNALVRQFEGERVETSESLRNSLDRVTEIGEQLNDPMFAALPKSIVGLTQVFAGEHRTGIANLEEAAPLLVQKRDFVGSSFALMAIGVGYARLGEFAKADEALSRAKEVAEGGDIIARIDTMIGESMVEVQRGNLEFAIPLARQCTGLAEDAGATACVVGSNLVLGESLMRQGEFAGAKIALDRSHDVAEVTNQRQFKPALTAMRRSAAAYMGDFNLSGRTFEEALGDAIAMNDLWAQANIPYLRAKAERAKPDPDWASMFADFESSASQLTEIGARPAKARVLREWGTALLQTGDRDAGEERLRSAFKLFEAMGLEREAGEVSNELEAAGTTP
jgi:tetratricopeptide (TPR) repeat protein